MFSIDTSTGFWIIFGLSFLLGIGVGWVAVYVLTGKNNRTRELQAELDELVENFQDYRVQVTRHFMQTSELVQEMTRSYRAVYEHLASGAQLLCSEDPENPRIGHTAAGRPADDGEDPATAELIAELSERADHIEELIGDSPHIPDLDAPAGPARERNLRH